LENWSNTTIKQAWLRFEKREMEETRTCRTQQNHADITMQKLGHTNCHVQYLIEAEKLQHLRGNIVGGGDSVHAINQRPGLANRLARQRERIGASLGFKREGASSQERTRQK
jgi:hypothetical protein